MFLHTVSFVINCRFVVKCLLTPYRKQFFVLLSSSIVVSSGSFSVSGRAFGRYVGSLNLISWFCLFHCGADEYK